MQPNRRRDRLALLLTAALLIYLARIWSMDAGRYVIYDDSYISFRYARNLARGEGLVFNPGERVEGYTNFLWTVLIAGGIRLGFDPIVASKALGIISGALILFLATVLTKHLTPGSGFWAAIPALLLAATASLPRYALSGMETLFFALWLCLALWLQFGVQRSFGPRLAALSLALGTLTRPEGLLFFGVLSLSWGMEQAWRGEKLREVLKRFLPQLAIFSAVIGLHFLWRHSFYGTILPNTYYAKAGGISSAALGRGLRYLFSQLMLLNLPLLVFGALGLRAWKQTGVPTMFAGLSAYLFYLVLIGGDDWAVFGPRFVLVIFPWLAVLGFAGLWQLASERRVALFAACVAALAMTAGLSLFEATGYKGVVTTMNRGWWNAAEWLEDQADENQVVAVDAAGIIPYYSDLPTLDMYGINDVHIAHLPVAQLGSGLAGHEKFDPHYVLGREPDYITSWLDVKGQPISAGLRGAADRLSDHYELVAVFLMGLPEPGEPTWLTLHDTPYSPEIHDRGYIYGILQRRE
jgi:hypothetical protein